MAFLQAHWPRCAFPAMARHTPSSAVASFTVPKMSKPGSLRTDSGPPRNTVRPNEAAQEAEAGFPAHSPESNLLDFRTCERGSAKSRHCKGMAQARYADHRPLEANCDRRRSSQGMAAKEVGTPQCEYGTRRSALLALPRTQTSCRRVSRLKADHRQGPRHHRNMCRLRLPDEQICQCSIGCNSRPPERTQRREKCSLVG